MSKEKEQQRKHMEIGVPVYVRQILLVHSHIAIRKLPTAAFNFTSGTVVHKILVLYVSAQLPAIVGISDAVYCLWGEAEKSRLLIKLHAFGSQLPDEASIWKIVQDLPRARDERQPVTDVPSRVSLQLRGSVEAQFSLPRPVNIRFTREEKLVALTVTQVFVELRQIASAENTLSPQRIAWCYSRLTQEAYGFLVPGPQTLESIESFLIDLTRQSEVPAR